MRWFLVLAGLGIIFIFFGVVAGWNAPVKYEYRYEVQLEENFRSTIPPEHTYSYQNLSEDEQQVFKTVLAEGEVRRDHSINGSHFTHVGGDVIGPGIGLTGVVYTNQTYVVTGWQEQNQTTTFSSIVLVVLGLIMEGIATLAVVYKVFSALVHSVVAR